MLKVPLYPKGLDNANIIGGIPVIAGCKMEQNSVYLECFFNKFWIPIVDIIGIGLWNGVLVLGTGVAFLVRTVF